MMAAESKMGNGPVAGFPKERGGAYIHWPGREALAARGDNSWGWRNGQMPVDRRSGQEQDVESSRVRSRSRSGESSPIQSNPKRRRLSDGNTQGCPEGQSPSREFRSSFESFPKAERDVPHMLELSYEAYLDYYHRAQSKIAALYTSGQLFWSGPTVSSGGARNRVVNSKQFSIPNGNATSMSRRGPQGPMSEAQYLDYCADYFNRIGRPFNEDLVRQYYWRMRNSYEHQMYSGREAPR